MPLNIKEPTYSERENELYRGVCSVINNIFGHKELFEVKKLEDYSRIFGLFAYIMAGLGTSGNPDMAGYVLRRYGKDVETYYGSSVATKELKRLNASYKDIRRVTDSEMKTSIDMDYLLGCQVSQLMKICNIVQKLEYRDFLKNNVTYFINKYMNKSTNNTVLPLLNGEKSELSGYMIPKDAEVNSGNTKGTVNSFYAEVKNYPAWWFRFHFRVRVPVGLGLSLLYTLVYFSENNVLAGKIELVVIAIDVFIFYMIMRRTRSSKVWLYVEFIYIMLLSVLTLEVSSIVPSLVWGIFNCIYFSKHLEFFDKSKCNDNQFDLKNDKSLDQKTQNMTQEDIEEYLVNLVKKNYSKDEEDYIKTLLENEQSGSLTYEQAYAFIGIIIENYHFGKDKALAAYDRLIRKWIGSLKRENISDNDMAYFRLMMVESYLSGALAANNIVSKAESDTISEKYGNLIEELEKEEIFPDIYSTSSTDNDTEKIAFCNKCGAPLVDNASFCNKCGASITDNHHVKIENEDGNSQMA